MEELEMRIIKFFDKSSRYYTKSQLIKKFNIRGENNLTIFNEALDDLENKGILYLDSKMGYRLFPKDMDMTSGVISISKNNRGCVINGNNKIIIDKEYLNGALDGDTVLLSKIINQGKTYSGMVSKIIKRKNGNLVYLVQGSGKNAKLIPYNIGYNIPVKLSNFEKNNLTDGDLVFVTLSNELNSDGFYTGYIDSKKRLDEPDSILKTVAFQNGVEVDFPKSVMEEVKNIPSEITEEDRLNRVDFTDKEIYTIDCDNTKDMDDAVGIEFDNDGNLVVYIAIADVAHYVKPGSKIYEEALKRGTSIYMDNSCIPMLPHELSNGICSLNEGVERLARVSTIVLDKSGNVIDFKKEDGIIKSRKKMKYSEVDKVIENKIIDSSYTEFIDSIRDLHNVTELLERQKINRGFIEFESTELSFIRNANNKIIDIVDRDNGKSGKLIENLMLLNNERSALRYAYRPYIYRVHDEPDLKKVKDAILVLKEAGYNVKDHGDYANNKVLKNLLETFRDTKDFKIISNLFLTTMKKAKYSVDPIGHYALSLDYYAHTTSPIRRIADLVDQEYERIYEKWEKENYTPTDSEIGEIRKFMYEVANNASATELMADKCERDAENIRLAEYMNDHIGETYPAKIFQVTSSAIYVIIGNKIKAKLDPYDIIGDEYKYNSDTRQYIGIKSRDVIAIGKSIDVTIKDVNIPLGQINLYAEANRKKLIK